MDLRAATVAALQIHNISIAKMDHYDDAEAAVNALDTDDQMPFTLSPTLVARATTLRATKPRSRAYSTMSWASSSTQKCRRQVLMVRQFGNSESLPKILSTRRPNSLMSIIIYPGGQSLWKRQEGKPRCTPLLPLSEYYSEPTAPYGQ